MQEFASCLLKFGGLIFFMSLFVLAMNELRLFILRKWKKRGSRKRWVDIKECDRVHARPGVNLAVAEKGERNES